MRTDADTSDAPQGASHLKPSRPVAAGNSVGTAERVVEGLLRGLFVSVVLLLLADFHSSYVSPQDRWETNPVITALAENFGLHVALVGVKTADLLCLGGLFALWRRSRAHLAVALVLSIIAIQYFPVVFANYFG